MFEKKYFTELYTKTHKMLLSKNFKKDSKEYKKNIEPNIAALKALAHDIEDEEIRNNVMNFVDNIGTKDYEFNLENISEKGEQSEEKVNLEKELLGLSKTLKRKVHKFQDIIKDDDDIIKKTHETFTRNYTNTKGNIIEMAKTNDISVFRTFLFIFIVFVIMYFFICFY